MSDDFNRLSDFRVDYKLSSLRNIIRDNMLVNPSGLEGHAMPMDKNIEHLIGDLKVCEQKIILTGIHLRGMHITRTSLQQKESMQIGIDWEIFLPVSITCNP